MNHLGMWSCKKCIVSEYWLRQDLDGEGHQDFQVNHHNVKVKGTKLKNNLTVHRSHGSMTDVPWKYRAVAIYSFWVMVSTKMSRWRSYIQGCRLKRQNNLTIYTFYMNDLLWQYEIAIIYSFWVLAQTRFGWMDRLVSKVTITLWTGIWHWGKN